MTNLEKLAWENFEKLALKSVERMSYEKAQAEYEKVQLELRIEKILQQLDPPKSIIHLKQMKLHLN